MDSEFLLVLYALMTSQPTSDVLYAQQQQQLTRVLSSPFPPVYYRISTHFIGPPSASFFRRSQHTQYYFFFRLSLVPFYCVFVLGIERIVKKGKKIQFYHYKITILLYTIEPDDWIFWGGERDRLLLDKFIAQ